jgi:phage FluMu gp28-like protein
MNDKLSSILSKIFCPYQKKYLRDNSRIKIWEKSRRIGATWTQAFEDILDNGKHGMNVWFTSIDKSAVEEYMYYVREWSRVIEFYSKKRIIKNDSRLSRVVFMNNFRIVGTSSNPNALRAKGGKGVWDEAAHHPADVEMKKAISAVTTFGKYPLRILSTPKGKDSVFNNYRIQAANGQKGWSLHTTSIYDASRDGIFDKLYGKKFSDDERNNLIEMIRADVGTDVFKQEFCCEVMDSTAAWLSRDLLLSCVSERCVPENYSGGKVYIGVDIARYAHYYVIWISELVGDTLVTMEVITLQNTKFEDSHQILKQAINRYKTVKVTVDRTAIGEAPTERMQREFGQIIKPVIFNSKTKFDMSTLLKKHFEKKTVLIPDREDILKSHLAIQRSVTAANNTVFDAKFNQFGHGDHYWAHALMMLGHQSEEFDFDTIILPPNNPIFHSKDKKGSRIDDYKLF